MERVTSNRNFGHSPASPFGLFGPWHAGSHRPVTVNANRQAHNQSWQTNSSLNLSKAPSARCYNAMDLPHAGISWLADSALAAWRLLWLGSASPLLGSAVESSVLAAPGDSCPSTEPGRPMFQAEPPVSHPPISLIMHMLARVHSKHRQPAAVGCGNSRYKD